jgi:hypothetical protein
VLGYVGLTSTKGKQVELRKERGRSEPARRDWLERGLRNLHLIRIQTKSTQTRN